MKRAALVAAVLFLAVPRVAAADDVDRCVAASERGQRDRRAGRLNDARSSFLVCAAAQCPAVVRSACGEWLEQVNASLPSVVIAVVDPDKRDVVDVRIAIDGKDIALGRAVTLDPGPHDLKIEASGFETYTQAFVAREGERSRSLVAALTRKPEKKEKERDNASTPKQEEGTGVPTLTWVAGGLTLAALGSFAFFAATGRSQAGDLRDTCAPSCPEADRDGVQTRYLVADISLVAALVFGGVGVWSYLSRTSR